VRTSIALLTLSVAFAALDGSTTSQTIETPAEQANYARYSQHQDIAAFLKTIAGVSGQAKVRVVGKTDPVKDFASTSIYLVIITDEGIDTPKALDRNKPTILVLGAQHGNEHSGKEAALTLVRDLAVGSLKPLLKRVNVLVMPQTNPYGNEANRRANQSGLDLNRDHVKLETAETRAIHGVFAAWMPEVTLDVHEKGDDYYKVNTGCVTNANIADAILRFSRDTVFREIEAVVSAGGSTWHEYLVTEAMGSQGAAGAPEPRGANREMLTRPSTTDLNDGRNSLGIYETISFIQEGASRHDVATLKDRTDYQYLGIKGLVQSVARHADQVLSLVSSSRVALLKKAHAPQAGDQVHLRMVHARDPKQPTLTLQRFEPAPTGSGAGTAAPKVIPVVVKNWFPRVEPTLSVARAYGYLIPSARTDVVQTLQAHGIVVQVLPADTEAFVEQYIIDDVTPATEDYVAPERIVVTTSAKTVTSRRGDYYVSGAQAAANLIPNLLEPQAEFGLIRYRAYKLVPEKGAVFPFLRVVKNLTLPPEAATPRPQQTPASVRRVAATYDDYLTGNPADVTTPTKGGLQLEGGGTDIDEAFRWLIAHSGGGDIVVIRASGADGYNQYLMKLGRVDSVESIVFKSREASFDLEIIRTLERAEAVFIAGGDQSNYVKYWKGTPVENTLNALAARGVPIGGTSAGLAVLGQFSYSAMFESVTGPMAMADPYSDKITLEREFLKMPHMAGIITDSHVGPRDRLPRTLAFLARIVTDGWAPTARGIAVDQESAVLVESDGTSTVVGKAPSYFIETTQKAEVCRPGLPPTMRGFRTYRVPPGGSFDLKAWAGAGGLAYVLSIDAGVVSSSNGKIY
jgi:cyanophycinase